MEILEHGSQYGKSKSCIVGMEYDYDTGDVFVYEDDYENWGTWLDKLFKYCPVCGKEIKVKVKS